MPNEEYDDGYDSAASFERAGADGPDDGEPRTWTNDDGEEKPERRRHNRDMEDGRIGHLFNGFDNMILSAKENGDAYKAGYLKAMRQELADVVREYL